MQFTDAWIVSGLDNADALAALGTSSILLAIFAVFGAEFMTGVSTLTAQARGRRGLRACGTHAWHGIWWALILGAAVQLYRPTAALVFDYFFQTHSPAVRALEAEWFAIGLWAIPAQFVSAALGSFYTGMGHTLRILVGTVAGLAVNAVLSWGLLHGAWGLPRMGFAGAAWGTVIASVFQALVLMGMFVGSRSLRRYCLSASPRFSRGRLWRLFRMGFPAGLHGCVDNVSWGLVLVWLVGNFGTAHLAAQTIMIRCITLSFLPADGLATALSSLVGRACGTGDWLGARRVARAGFILIAGWMTSLALIYVIFRDPLLRLFTDEPAVLEAGKAAILWVAAFQLFDALNVTYTNALQGAGDTLWPAALNILFSVLVLLGGGVMMVLVFPQFESAGVWAMATAYIICQGVTFALRWRTRAWQRRATRF